MQRIRELDGLRAIAILLVLGCHYAGFSSFFGGLPRFGWIGVDLFFSLSGYLITTILLGLRDRSKPYRTFYSRRLLRILPPYVAVIAIVAVCRIEQHKMYPAWVASQLLFLQAFDYTPLHAMRVVLTSPIWHVTHLPSLLHSGLPLPLAEPGAPLTVLIVPYILWSLSIEEYFYFLWAPVVLRFSRVTILAVGIAVCLLEVFLRWSVATASTYYSVGFRFDALLYGAFLALLLEQLKTKRSRNLAKVWLSIVLASSVFILGAVLWFIRPVLGRDPRQSALYLVAGMPTLSIAFTALIGLLILYAGSGWWPAAVLRTRVLQWIGAVSYTMYLVHLIAAAFVRTLWGQQAELQQTFPQAIISTLLTVGLAQASWRYLESPVLRWKDRHFPNAPHPPEPKPFGS